MDFTKLDEIYNGLKKNIANIEKIKSDAEELEEKQGVTQEEIDKFQADIAGAFILVGNKIEAMGIEVNKIIEATE